LNRFEAALIEIQNYTSSTVLTARLVLGINSQLNPFFNKKDELPLHEGCILWGTRVVVPFAYRDAVLIELHEGHPGMVKMKESARMYVWWPMILRRP